MSRVFQQKNKDLVSLEIKTSDEVWNINKSGKAKLSKEYDYFGKIDKGTSIFIKKTNRDGKSVKYVEDTCKLPKIAKNKIVDLFDNKNKRVVYLVKKKKSN